MKKEKSTCKYQKNKKKEIRSVWSHKKILCGIESSMRYQMPYIHIITGSNIIFLYKWFRKATNLRNVSMKLWENKVSNTYEYQTALHDVFSAK